MLWYESSGIWYHAELDDDSETGDEAAAFEVVEPSAWMWYLRVERGSEDKVKDEELRLMSLTEFDPRLVEYGMFGGDGAHAYTSRL